MKCDQCSELTSTHNYEKINYLSQK